MLLVPSSHCKVYSALSPHSKSLCLCLNTRSGQKHPNYSKCKQNADDYCILLEEDKNERKKKKSPLNQGETQFLLNVVLQSRTQEWRSREAEGLAVLCSSGKRKRSTASASACHLPRGFSPEKKKRQIANIKLNKTNGTDVAGY